jgi:hypothetical protein
VTATMLAPNVRHPNAWSNCPLCRSAEVPMIAPAIMAITAPATANTGASKQYGPSQRSTPTHQPSVRPTHIPTNAPAHPLLVLRTMLFTTGEAAALGEACLRGLTVQRSPHALKYSSRENDGAVGVRCSAKLDDRSRPGHVRVGP